MRSVGVSTSLVKHLLGIGGATAAIVLCTLLPFLPGRYDSLAAPVSMMAQLLGKVGLSLVPLGALWIAAMHWRRLTRMRSVFAITALIASVVVWGFVSLGAFVDSVTLGLAAFGLGTFALMRILRRVRRDTRTAVQTASAVPIYLVTVPIAVALIQLALARPATEFSRDRAIRNSAPLIADIERYRTANGRYPRSVVSVHRDYLPGVIGIREYRYEPSGDAYNVLFEQVTLALGTIEVVMYNPRNEQAISSHALDVLQLTPEQLALDQTRGHYAVHNARHPHWKYFWFD